MGRLDSIRSNRSISSSSTYIYGMGGRKQFHKSQLSLYDKISRKISLGRPASRKSSYGHSQVHTCFSLAKTPECDISVSRLPRLETFANFLVVSVSVSENLVSKKKSRYRYRKIKSRKKVSVSVSTDLVSLEKSRYWYRKIWSRKKSFGIGLRKFGLGKKVTKKKWAKVARTCL